MSVSHHDDPGWPSPGRIVLAFVPLLNLFSMRRARGASGIGPLRILHIQLVGSPLWLLLVLWFLRTGPALSSRDLVPIAVVTASGMLSAVGIRYVRSRPLDVTSSDALANSYRAVYFLGFAVADAPALVGFGAFFLAEGGLGVYLIGMAFGLWGLWRIAPGRTDVARRQAEIHARGSDLSLIRALDEHPGTQSGP